MPIGTPSGKIPFGVIATGPFHPPVPTTHETFTAPSLSIVIALSILSVCLAIANGDPGLA
jgi:hypothetical protein